MTEASPSWRRSTGMLLALVLLLYGANLGDGPLSDDELYLARADHGASLLLLSVTVDSAPQMFRPWPALFWLAPVKSLKLPLLHLISLLLHAAVTILILRLTRRRSAVGPSKASFFLAALFAAFPLTTEAILWLSASFDLWAAFWALLSLEMALDETSSGGEAPILSRNEAFAVAAFVLALLSKESILPLPLLAVLLFGRRIRRRLIAIWTGMVTASLALRLALFGSLGGYAGADGQPLSLQPWLTLRNLFVQVPFRLLQPVREWAASPADAGAVALAAAMLVCLGLAAWALGFGRRLPDLWQLPAAWLLAALPLGAIFGIDPHHGNGRLLYFPVAIGAVALSGAMAPRDRHLRWLYPLLAAFVLAAFANAQVFRRAAEGKENLLAKLKATEELWPARAVVQVDAPDTVLGVPVWRSAEAALERSQLRRDLSFAVGHPSLLVNPQGLGKRILVLGLDETGRLVDWTRCEQDLRQPIELSAATSGGEAVAEISMVFAPPGLARLYLWPPGGRPVVASAVMFLPPAAHQKVRLRLPPGMRPPLDYRVDAEDGETITATVELLEAPESCREPHVVNSGPSQPEEKP